MAAATQVPAGNWLNKGKVIELIADINTLVDLGVVTATSETVATLLTNLATERDAR